MPFFALLLISVSPSTSHLPATNLLASSLSFLQLAEVEGVGGGLNPLCVRICTFPSLPASAAPFIPDTVLVAVGGVDKFLTLYRVETK